MMMKKPDREEELHNHNLQMSEGSDMYPPIIKNLMNKGTLGGTHVGFLMRLGKAGKCSAVTGKSFVPADDDSDWKNAMQDVPFLDLFCNHLILDSLI